jgi:acetyl esterase/lipase
MTDASNNANPDHLEPDPSLWAIKYMPALRVNSWTLPFIRNGIKVSRAIVSFPPPSDVTLKDLYVPGSTPSQPAIPVRSYAPSEETSDAPLACLLWIHGGGYVLGDHIMDESANIARVQMHKIKVVSVDYRLAPDHPAPAGIEDCYATWLYLLANHKELGIDPKKIVIGGASAGGGMAASLVQKIMDTDPTYPPLFQYLLYPMLDDRTTLKPKTLRYIWTCDNNIFGWTSYLGQPPSFTSTPPEYAVPSRRTKSFQNFPPTYIGVGTIDLFHSEDLDYARRLREDGVEVKLDEIPGGFHGFEGIPLFKGTPLMVDFKTKMDEALSWGLSQASK